jgi:hypothetical protein
LTKTDTFDIHKYHRSIGLRLQSLTFQARRLLFSAAAPDFQFCKKSQTRVSGTQVRSGFSPSEPAALFWPFTTASQGGKNMLDGFIQVQGIVGESSDDAHPSWIEIFN